jgi:hypothetical protein
MIHSEHKENTSEGFEADKKAPNTYEDSPEANKAEQEEIPSTAESPVAAEKPVKKRSPKKEAVEAEVKEPAAVEAKADVQEVAPEVEKAAEATETTPISTAENVTPAAEIATMAVAEVEDSEEVEEEHEEEQHDEEAYANLNLEQLISLFVETSKEENLASIRTKMNVLRGMIEHHFEQERAEKLAAFIADDNKEEDFAPTPNPLHLLFLETLSKYGHRRSKEKETREQALLTNFKAKEAMLEQLHQLIEDEETKGITDIDKLRTIQQQWKETGAVPPAHRNEQWQKYHFLIDKFYDNLRINRELKELDLQKNLEGKVELCEKAEELLLEPSIKKAIETLNLLHEHWKQIGPVPREQKDSIWERFKAASDKVYDKRKSYFSTLDAEREGNFIKKTALCEKVEAILETPAKEHQGWQKLSEQVEALQAEWKTIGFAPKATNSVVWRRFKQACDQFFTAKNLFYRTIRQEQIENLQAKEALCAQAESLMESEDWKATTETIIRLQKEWKKIGAVNRKASDKVWQRFRKACDAFFERKNQHFGGQDARHEENLKLKVALIERIEAFVGSGNQKTDLDALKDFQREWLEIGFIPLKDKKDINDRYRNALNKHFDELKISTQEKTKLNFQQKIETIKSGKDGDRGLRKEQFQIQTRISHLNNDILLWQNNMEFFAKSKNADMLRKEIEQKIERARNEMAQLKEKLLLLRDA